MKLFTKLGIMTALGLGLMGTSANAQDTNNTIFDPNGNLSTELQKPKEQFSLPTRKIEANQYRMMGGVDIVLDEDYNPANIALQDEPFKIRAFGIEYRASLRNPEEIYDTIRDIIDFARISPGKFATENEYRQDILTRILEYDQTNIRAQARIDLLQLSFGSGDIGAFMLGGYAEGDTTIKADFSDLERLIRTVNGFIEGNTLEIFTDSILQDLTQILQNQSTTGTTNPPYFKIPISSVTSSDLITSITTQIEQETGINLNGMSLQQLSQLDQQGIEQLIENNPQVQNMTPQEVQDLINKIYRTATTLNLGKKYNPIQIIARADIGTYIGLGKRFTLFTKTLKEAETKQNPDGTQTKIPGEYWTVYASFGIRGRGFYRYAIPKFDLIIPQYINLTQSIEDQIHVPTLTTIEGPGYGVDLYLTLALNDPIFNTKMGVEMIDALNRTFYKEIDDLTEDIKINFGLAIHPLHSLKLKNQDVIIGFDAENLEKSRPTYQIGLAWRIGSQRNHIMPKIGYIIDEKDLFGERSSIFTAGARIRLGGSLRFDAVYEKNMDNHTTKTGFSLGLDF